MVKKPILVHMKRCADYEGKISMYSKVYPVCKFFWFDCGPKDPSGEVPGQYRLLACSCDGEMKEITMGVINHTARRGCCSFEPELKKEK